MAVNKVVFDGATLIDLSGDTVTEASHIVSGHTGHLSDGTLVAGTGGVRIGTATATPSSNSTSISFTVSGEPKAFAVINNGSYTMTSGYYIVMGVTYDGTTTKGNWYYYKSGGGSGHTVGYSATAFSFTFSGSTLTVRTSSSTSGGYFASGRTYSLVYIY